MFKMPTPPYSGADFYKIRLSESCSKNILSKYQSLVPFSAKYPKDNENAGTLSVKIWGRILCEKGWRGVGIEE